MVGGASHAVQDDTPLVKQSMFKAIAFAITLVTLGIFLPHVYHALDTFLVTFLAKATEVVESLPTSSLH